MNFSGTIVPEACNCIEGAGWGCLLTLFQNTLHFLIGLGVLLAVAAIAYAGFLMIMNPANPGGIQKGKTMMLNAVIGLVIALAAWLIVNTLFTVLTNGTLTSYTAVFGAGYNAPCLPTAKDQQGSGQGSANLSSSTIPGNTTPGASTASGDEAAVRKQLADAGVGVNHDACPAGSSGSGCTDVGGLQQATIAQIIALARAAGVSGPCDGSNSCKVVVTGGNEPGHAVGTYSHGNGYKFDLRLGSPVDSWIQSNLISVGQRTGDSGGPAWTDNCTRNQSADQQNQYVKESDHWDVRITAACNY
jgi:hypothetical protein